jgi:hypothetical protein
MRSATLLLGLLAASAALAQQPGQTERQTSSDQPAYSVVEPKAPAKARPAVKKRAAQANAKVEAEAPVVASAEPLKPKGPCVIKPVMSDQDLVNCGATPHD